MSEAKGYLVLCVHATRRTRKDADPGAREVRCEGCGATVLLNSRMSAHLDGAAMHPVCPSCMIAIAGPDDLVGDAINLPETARLLEQDGVPDGEAFMAERAGMTIREFAQNALRNTVGGQG